MYYGIFDANGRPTAFYNDEIHSDIPAEAVAITDDQWQVLLDGEHAFVQGAVVQYTPPSPSNEILLERLRNERNNRLTACDWTQLPDAPLTSDQRTAWQTYRQALRDFPATCTDPANPTWPTEPSA